MSTKDLGQGGKDSAERFSMSLPGLRTKSDEDYFGGLGAYFDASLGDTIDKLRNFPKYVPHSALNRFLCRHALFQQVMEVHGSILECGVHLGGGLMSWAQLSGMFEPLNYNRKIIGFDTFEGFPSVHEKDAVAAAPQIKAGLYNAPALEDIQEAVRLYDLGRPLNHIPKVELVAGNALQTIPQYIADNPHLVVALLYLDFDIYEPTKAALESLVVRMPKGAIIAFDELGVKHWPGETLATLEVLGLRNLRVRRFPHQAQISYAVLE
jgi:hypothetical protein